MKLKDFDFRIWDNVENKYIEAKSYLCIAKKDNNKDCERILDVANDCSGYNDISFNNYTDDRYDIELFTGLYDKKDKKVYENDIVKVKSLYNYFLAKISIHKEGTFYFEGKNGDYIGSLIYLVEDEGYTIEAIGNIHENAELLK
ncbi:TPA: hypothetical protein SB588_001076 [Campylobacter coli]|nr:hypothetical protein [Campylobacter coli]HEG0609328.1 hypothetical protein [Campylobacter coli]